MAPYIQSDNPYRHTCSNFLEQFFPHLRAPSTKFESSRRVPRGQTRSSLLVTPSLSACVGVGASGRRRVGRRGRIGRDQAPRPLWRRRTQGAVSCRAPASRVGGAPDEFAPDEFMAAAGPGPGRTSRKSSVSGGVSVPSASALYVAVRTCSVVGSSPS